MTDDNLIHVRVKYPKAVEAKKDLLSTEMSLLYVSKNINRYRELKIKEFEIKENLHKKIKSVKASIRKLEKLLPKTKIPKPVKKVKKEVNKKKTTQEKVKEKSGTLDNQLMEIQNRLNKLQKESSGI